MSLSLGAILLILLGTFLSWLSNEKSSKKYEESLEKIEKYQAENKLKGNLKLKLKKNKTYKIRIGTNLLVLRKKQLEQGVSLVEDNYKNTLLGAKLINDSLMINGVFYDLDGNLVGEIKNSKWGINSQNYSSINYDDSGLEVLDNRGHVALQLTFEDDILEVKGIMVYKDGFLIINDHNFKTVTFLDSELDKKVNYFSNRIPRKFEHIGKNYLGKRVSDKSAVAENINVSNVSKIELMQLAKSKIKLLEKHVQKIKNADKKLTTTFDKEEFLQSINEIMPISGNMYTHQFSQSIKNCQKGLYLKEILPKLKIITKIQRFLYPALKFY